MSASFLDDPNINAANAGGGKFLHERLLEKANDEQLRGVMAHEVAHEDKGHVTELQTIGAGVGVASVLLNQSVPSPGPLYLWPGICWSPSRTAGKPSTSRCACRHPFSGDRTDGKAIMTNTLTWLKETAGSSKVGFLHSPSSDDRIQKVQEIAMGLHVLPIS